MTLVAVTLYSGLAIIVIIIFAAERITARMSERGRCMDIARKHGGALGPWLAKKMEEK